MVILSGEYALLSRAALTHDLRAGDLQDADGAGDLRNAMYAGREVALVGPRIAARLKLGEVLDDAGQTSGV